MFILIFLVIAAAGVIGLILLGDFIVCCCSGNINEDKADGKRHGFGSAEEGDVSSSGVPYGSTGFPILILDGPMNNEDDDNNILTNHTGHHNIIDNDTVEGHCNDNLHERLDAHNHYQDSNESHTHRDVVSANDSHHSEHGGNHSDYSHHRDSGGNDFGGQTSYETSRCDNDGGNCDTGGGGFE